MAQSRQRILFKKFGHLQVEVYIGSVWQDGIVDSDLNLVIALLLEAA